MRVRVGECFKYLCMCECVCVCKREREGVFCVCVCVSLLVVLNVCHVQESMMYKNMYFIIKLHFIGISQADQAGLDKALMGKKLE